MTTLLKFKEKTSGSKSLRSPSISIPVPESAQFQRQAVNTPVMMFSNPFLKPSQLGSADFSTLACDRIFHTREYAIKSVS